MHNTVYPLQGAGNRERRSRKRKQSESEAAGQERTVYLFVMPRKLEGLAPRRLAAGMTQQQLADALHVERATLAMWEIGKSWPSARVLPLIADTLLCSIDDLYTAPEEDTP